MVKTAGRLKDEPIKKEDYSVLHILKEGEATLSQITKKLSNAKVPKSDREASIQRLIDLDEINMKPSPFGGRGRATKTFNITTAGSSTLKRIENGQLKVKT